MNQKRFLVLAAGMALIIACISILVWIFAFRQGVTSPPSDHATVNAVKPEASADLTVKAPEPATRTDSPDIDIPPEILESIVRKAGSRARERRLREEFRKSLSEQEQQRLKAALQDLHRSLQRIERGNVRILRRVTQRGKNEIADVKVVKLLQPTPEQVVQYHAACSALLNSIRTNSSPQLEKTARSEIESALQSYANYPYPYHVVSMSDLQESGGKFFQAKYTSSLSDVLEREEYFSYSSDELMLYQGDFKDEEIITRYGYLFERASAVPTSGR